MSFTLPKPKVRERDRSRYVDYDVTPDDTEGFATEFGDGAVNRRVVRLSITHDKNRREFYASASRIEVGDRFERMAISYRRPDLYVVVDRTPTPRFNLAKLHAFADQAQAAFEASIAAGEHASLVDASDPEHWLY